MAAILEARTLVPADHGSTHGPSELSPQSLGIASHYFQKVRTPPLVLAGSLAGHHPVKIGTMPGVRSLESWASHLTQTFPLSTLKDAAIGVDAHFFLDSLLNRIAREPLLNGLGGFPFALKNIIEKALADLKASDITPVFVFNGLDFGKQDLAISQHAAAGRAHDQAWALYDDQQADKVVAAFTSAGATVETLSLFLQRILYERGVDFMVAPYSAAAQLAYLEKQPEQFIDAIMGSTELFLYGVDKIILKFEHLGEEHQAFRWLSKKSCQEELQRIPDDLFVDACLLLGSSYLPTFPALETPAFSNKGANIRDALAMLNSAGKSVITLCNQHQDDNKVQSLDYVDRYKRAVMTLKHHVVLETDGKVQPLDAAHAPKDMHELVGQRLPEEVYFYISKGLLGPRIPNWLTRQEIRSTLPLGSGDSQEYHKFIGQQLVPIWTQSISLLSSTLHRFYQAKPLSLQLWFDDANAGTINLREQPSVKDKVAHWKVKSSALPESLRTMQTKMSPLMFAIESAKDSKLIGEALSKTDSKDKSRTLESKEEVISNTFWRFLQLRGFIGDDNKLTTWGETLEAALSSLDESDRAELEEPVFLALELLRLGELSSRELFPSISGGPMRLTGNDKEYAVLISRVACLGKLHHKPIGYSGPLSRQLFSYRGLISAVRTTFREQVEVILANLLLNGDVSRDRNDWTDIALSLPFIDDNDCGLGIAVRTYFDDLPNHGDKPLGEVVELVKGKGKTWFQHGHSFSGNLEKAFKLWDAVYGASQSAGKDVKDAKLFADANNWLSARR